MILIFFVKESDDGTTARWHWKILKIGVAEVQNLCLPQGANVAYMQGMM